MSNIDDIFNKIQREIVSCYKYSLIKSISFESKNKCIMTRTIVDFDKNATNFETLCKIHSALHTLKNEFPNNEISYKILLDETKINTVIEVADLYSDLTHTKIEGKTKITAIIDALDNIPLGSYEAEIILKHSTSP